MSFSLTEGFKNVLPEHQYDNRFPVSIITVNPDVPGLLAEK